MEKKFTIHVVPVKIAVAPFPYPETPGEVIEISATAANALTTPYALTASVPSGEGQILSGRRTGNYKTVRFRTPKKRDTYPTAVQFRWRGRKLPPLSPPRVANAVVRIDDGEITITGGPACLTAGETFKLNAQLKGFASGHRGVTWSTSGAGITNGSGLSTTVTAPGNPGTFTVTVTADADSSVQDTNQYRVSRNCIKKVWFPTARIDLDGNGQYGGGTSGELLRNGTHQCGGTSSPVIQEAELNTPDQLAMKPPEIPPKSALWFNKTATLTRTFTHSSMRFQIISVENEPDTCEHVNLDGHNFSTVSYSANGGTMSYSFETDLATECKTFPSGKADVCVQGGTRSVVLGYYYLTIDSETTYHWAASSVAKILVAI